MSRFLLLIAAMAFFVIGLAFHLKNDHDVLLNYFLGTAELPFSFFIISSAILGVIFGMVSTIPMIFRLKRQNRRLLRQIDTTEKEVKNLRALPIKDTP